MDSQSSPYDAIPYQGEVVSHSAPGHLALCSAWHHGPRPPGRGFHLTELGCGDGSNLLPVAFYHPDSTFIGIDSSGVGIERAREGAGRLGLRNIRFVLEDVRRLEPSTTATSDYIVAHGLYSWVSDDARDAILAFCRHNLSPGGLAYVSYNANPGWAIRRVVRDALLRAPSVRQAAAEHKAARAIEVATRLLQDLPSRDHAHAVLLAEELERVRNGKPFYIFHEYLAELNEGFWLGDFVERALRHGLDYVADAQFCRWEGQVPVDLKASLANRDLDGIEQEEAADLLGNRFFRASIVCQADAPRAPASHPELLEEAHVATSLSAQSDPFDLSDGVVERFRGRGGAVEPEATLDGAITKAAVVLLTEQWPRGTRLKELFERAMKLLVAHGIKATNHPRSQLSAELTTLFEAGQVDLRLDEPPFSSEIPEYPRAHALARFEAAHREALTTPFHASLPVEPAAAELLRAADGSRSLEELEAEHGKALTQQTLAAAARFGLSRRMRLR